MRDFTDEALVAIYRSSPDSPGGNESINELFRRHISRVSTWCYRMTGDKQTAADLAQEVFLKAYRHMESFRGDSKFTTWLYTIARNHCFNARVARDARPEDSVEPFLLDMTTDKTPGPEVRIERQEREDALRNLIQESLDPLEAQVMSLHYGEEMRLDSISRLLGLTNTSGAKAYIVSARRKLARAISAKSFPKSRRKAQQP